MSAALERFPEPQDPSQPPQAREDGRPLERHATDRTARASGLVVAIAGHRWTVPMATIGGALIAACTIAYQIAHGHVEAYEDRLSKLESSVAQIRSDGGADHALLLDIRSQLAEIRAVLMRRGP